MCLWRPRSAKRGAGDKPTGIRLMGLFRGAIPCPKGSVRASKTSCPGVQSDRGPAGRAVCLTLLLHHAIRAREHPVKAVLWNLDGFRDILHGAPGVVGDELQDLASRMSRTRRRSDLHVNEVLGLAHLTQIEFYMDRSCWRCTSVFRDHDYFAWILAFGEIEGGLEPAIEHAAPADAQTWVPVFIGSGLVVVMHDEDAAVVALFEREQVAEDWSHGDRRIFIYSGHHEVDRVEDDELWLYLFDP